MKRKIIMLVMLFGLFCASATQAQIYVDVDVAVVLAVNKHALQSDAGVIDTGVVFNDAGMDLTWVFMPCAGPATATAITPADTGNHEWEVLDAGLGMYSMQLPATGGTVDNDTEGSGWFEGKCTATLAWSSPIYIFRIASKNNAGIEDAVDPIDLADIQAETLDALEDIGLHYWLDSDTTINADGDFTSIVKDGSLLSMQWTIAGDTSAFKSSEDSMEAQGTHLDTIDPIVVDLAGIDEIAEAVVDKIGFLYGSLLKTMKRYASFEYTADRRL